MSVDDRLRNGLKFEPTGHRVEVERLLGEIERSATQRRRRRIGTVLLAAACVVGLLVVLLSPGSDTRRSVPPTQPSSDDTTSAIVSSIACNTALFVCVDGVPRAMTMGTTVRWDGGPSFRKETALFTANKRFDEVLLVELDRLDLDVDQYAGVDIVQRVRAASMTRTGRSDPRVPVDARAIAEWLAQRPDLRTSPVRSETIDGRPAWSVTVRTKVPDKDAIVRCNDRFECTPILHVTGAGEESTQGLFEGLVTRFTFLEVPGSGVVSIWSWALPDDERLLKGNRALIQSIEFD